MEKNEKTILVFCAREQEDTKHTIDIDGNGEIVLTCVECGSFVKYPKGTSSEELKDHIKNHKISNDGQITQESLEKQKAELLDGLDSEEEEVEEE